MITSTAINNEKPKNKDYKLGSGEGLFLLITKAGGKYWKLKYRIGGKEGRYSIGKYPDLSLKEARKKSGEVRKQVDQDIHPKVNDRRLAQQRWTEAACIFRVVSDQKENCELYEFACRKKQRQAVLHWAYDSLNF